MSEFELSSLKKGKVVVISAVPSVDTGICELQTKRFNEEASKFEDVVILTISCDLPLLTTGSVLHLALKTSCFIRLPNTWFWIKIQVFDRGLAIAHKECDCNRQEGVVRYQEYAKEVKTHVDYDKALEAIEKLV